LAVTGTCPDEASVMQPSLSAGLAADGGADLGG
jgi:hypothetical protein